MADRMSRSVEPGTMTITHRAVLIGINDYESDPLVGCVRDVASIKAFLQTGWHGCAPGAMRIDTLTAPVVSDSPDPPTQTISGVETWSTPTLQNVKNTLECIAELPEPCQFLYIHFSGHGTGSGGDLALRLLDDNLKTKCLAKLLNKIVERGALVTLVLDCCFSGGVVRLGNARDRAVRYSPTDGIPVGHLGQSLQQPAPTLQTSRAISPYQDPQMNLKDPSMYTIFCASSPHELAKEVKLDGDKISGALSFFLREMFRALKAAKMPVPNQEIYRNLVAQFHVLPHRQTPQMYGNPDLAFFGSETGPVGRDSSTVAILRVQPKKDRGEHSQAEIYLQAGRAHGTSEGDVFTVYHYRPQRVGRSRPSLTKVKVVEVGSNISRITSESPDHDLSALRTGWKAKLVGREKTLKISVQLSSNVRDTASWVEAAKSKLFFTFLTSEQQGEPAHCLFKVKVNSAAKYEILEIRNASEHDEKVNYLAPLQTVSQVVDQLEHL
ncbi:caspase domain-containing protein [Cladorrhinum sp. PSN259]|nr:caspase domain-containing protein [Cladorrhinum sp. PSN259]